MGFREGPIYRVLCVTVACATFFAVQVSSAAVGDVTTSKPKLDLSNAELNGSASRNVYQTAQPPRRSQDSTGSAAQVGFYKTDIPNAGVPSGLRGSRRSQDSDEDGQLGKLRSGGRGNANLHREDAETIDEDDLKGKRRGRPGSRGNPGAGGGSGFEFDEDDSEELNQSRGRSAEQRVPPPPSPRPGYKPFGGSEIVPSTPKKKEKKDDDDDFKSDDDDGGEYAEPSGSYNSAGEAEDYKGGSAAEEEDDSGQAGESGDSASYKNHAEPDDDSSSAHHDDSHSDSSPSRLEHKSHAEDIRPVVEDTGDHGSLVNDDSHAGHVASSSDSKSELKSAPLHHGGKDYHYAKGGEAKHKADHHVAKGEKVKKGFKKGEEHSSGEKGKSGKEQHKAHKQDKKGHKDAHLDQAGKYAEKHAADKGKTGSEFEDKGKHKKGHSTKGFRKVHRKDEFKKDETFYDESDTQGQHKKKGAAEKVHHGKKGEKAQKKHHDSKLDEGKAHKESAKGHGAHESSKKGHKGVEKEEGAHHSISKGAKESSEKAAHKKAHAKSGKGHDDY